MSQQVIQKETEAFKQLKAQLREMFQLNRGDLDFGIYRIMNKKSDEINEFLDKQLLPQVRKILEDYHPVSESLVQEELNKLLVNLNDAGVDPEASPKVKGLRSKLDQSVDINALENDIYSDLCNFFKRYYSDGDFMSMRRYKEGVYALPYEGEEVKLHWANHDQYYIKTSENLKNYSFKTSCGKQRVRFEVVAGRTETNNNKAAEGKERRFILHADAPVQVNSDELTIRFEYRPDHQKRKQEEINKETLDQLLNLAETTIFGLKEKAPTEKNTDRTLLEKHLTEYTAKNTFDYFIHKDLGKFLRRELDFYIKNEIMNLDDIENETAPKVETYLAKVKAMRKVAGKIIQFLAQLEDFQKKLWLKKKFVLETHYCVTLDHIIGSDVADELLPLIVANDAQREEWVKLFAIEDVKGYTKPLTLDFLKANDKLLVDTKFFDTNFKYTLLSIFDDLDEQTNGLLINSENFQALNLLQERYKQKIKCIYIDPPYNTSASEIIYKNSFKHSSWMSFIENRLLASFPLMSDDAITCVTIDDAEIINLWPLLNGIFNETNHLATALIRNNPQGRSTVKGFAVNHEFGLFYAKDASAIAGVGRLDRSDKQNNRYNETDENSDKFLWENFRKTGTDSNKEDRPKQYYPIYYNGSQFRIPQMEWDNNKKEWMIFEEPSSDETVLFPDTDNGNKKVWKWGNDRTKENPDHLKFEGSKENGYQVFRRNYLNNEGALPSTWWDQPKYAAGSHGTNLLTGLFGKTHTFSFPKSVYAVEDSLKICGAKNKVIALDYFAGSATTGHAVINLNREDKGQRKYILVEMGEYFRSVTKPRIQKVIYSNDWKDGKPVSRDGVSQVVKYMALEQYEDALDNLGFNKSGTQLNLLASNPTFNEQYMLGYMLDVESRGSQSLLNIDDFADPFAYKLRITRNDDTQVINVDLIETFNYLLGLTVRKVSQDELGIVTITGENSLGENCLIIWRNVNDIDNTKLDAWFDKRYTTQGCDFGVVYVNGDNNIENMKLADDQWKVRLIEAEFKRLMFDVQNV